MPTAIAVFAALPNQGLSCAHPLDMVPRTRTKCCIDDHDEQADAWLVDDVRHRCERAIEAVYRRHIAAVTRVSRRVTREDRYAEEVGQEVFATLWHKPEMFDPSRASLRTWLIMLAHRRAVDLVRIEQRFVPRSPSAPIMREVTADSPPIDTQVSDSWNAALTRRALTTLPESQRTVLVLSYFEGFTQQQIATHLDLPLGTVKTRTRAALGAMRAALEFLAA